MKIMPNRMDRGFHQYQKEFEEKAIEVLRSGWYVLGKEVSAFEKEFASNPRLNVEAVRTLLGASGQRPSEAKVQQVYRQILNQQKATLNTKKK